MIIIDKKTPKKNPKNLGNRCVQLNPFGVIEVIKRCLKLKNRGFHGVYWM